MSWMNSTYPSNDGPNDGIDRLINGANKVSTTTIIKKRYKKFGRTPKTRPDPLEERKIKIENMMMGDG
jgi:hypothetical protein